MGCASSTQVKASVAADVYRPPPTSIAVFDINTVEEPWLITATTDQEHQQEEEEEEEEKIKEQKPNQLPLIFLEKLDSNELTPHSWSEVSKAFEELKPSLTQITTTTTTTTTTKKQQQQKTKQQTVPPIPRSLEITGLRPVKENMFIIQDREQRENNNNNNIKKWSWRRDPLEGYPDCQPPGNPDGVVLYTTSLRGVRRTFEECEQTRRIVEGNAVDAGIHVDERDVSLHGEFLKEVRELAGNNAAASVVPRLFVRGKHVGGAEEVLELSESGKLREMMRWVRGSTGKDQGIRSSSCEGCGGARFVPCFECSGSCKVVAAEDGKVVVRCGKCNENGLILCPLCH